VTPLQMALVPRGRNDGVDHAADARRPHRRPDGKVIQRHRPDTWKEPMKPQTAAELTAMMTAVVRAGPA
jgi:membrane peptidoglycan carboxypeptidase